MSYLLCNLSNENLSVEMCILELIKESLKKEALSIAVRFNPKTHKIQVVDNGCGFTKHELARIFLRNEENKNSYASIFDKISALSNSIILTSRSKMSSHTYVKIVHENDVYKSFKGHHRPSKGTTVTIYDFNSSKWNNEDNKNNSISYVIAAIAFTELKVSFSLRNDNQKKMLLNINNPHSPWEILNYLQHNESCEIFHESVPQVIKANHANFSVNKLELEKKCNLLSEKSQKMLNNESKEQEKSFSRPSVWPSWSYNTASKDMSHNTNDSDNKIYSNLNLINKSSNDFISLSQLSVWSDWSFHPENSNITKSQNNFYNNFPSISIYKMLPYKNSKTLTVSNECQYYECPSLSDVNDLHLNFNIKKTVEYFPNLKNIKICTKKRKVEECKISGNIINSLQVLNQVNKEFIVAISNENGKRLLIAIDQHAIHERIHYEWLLETYREKASYNYYSVELYKDIVFNFDKRIITLITANKRIFNKVGLNIKSIIDATTCLIDAVPTCFIKKTKTYDNQHDQKRLKNKIRQLILEITKGFSISKSIIPPLLPITINNAIASEACHEAIKFGDPLTVKDCTLLIRALQDTKAPTRCAHGRPSIVPLMNLTDLDKLKCCGNGIVKQVGMALPGENLIELLREKEALKNNWNVCMLLQNFILIAQQLLHI